MLQRVFSVPERTTGGGNVIYEWQQKQGNYLATAG